MEPAVMEFIHQVIQFTIHLDTSLGDILKNYGTWTYAILFVVLFAETGLVVTPFLPGDSLLFAVGAFAGRGDLSISTIFFLLFTAVFLGDNTNYWIGYFVGPRVFSKDNVRFLNRKHLDRTHSFFERYGPKAIIFARFVPIVRTCMPFVAGIGRMPYPRFLQFSIVGCLLWLSLCLFGGYFFGGLPFVKNNFTLVILAIIFISVLPPTIEVIRHRRAQTEAA